MSARAPIGSSNRADLFSARGDVKSGMNSARSEAKSQLDEKGHDDKEYGSVDESDPLQLEHMLGFAGDFRKTVLTSPFQENVFIKRYYFLNPSFSYVYTSKSFMIALLMASLGSLVSVDDLNDPHNQKFLRGHDMTVEKSTTDL